ncbi:CatB-related O-acetyltransferase [Gordonibacter sp.]|uniref:CatB-related O-acetyltransferase n=1 Tax=Gordonibacter sp. TaxID=1968902 RepID=UPI00321FE42C
MGLKTYLKKLAFQKKWRSINPHNSTRVSNVFDLSVVSVGAATYGELNVLQAGSQSTLTIGSYCSIAKNVSFVINNEHPLSHLSTFPFKAKVLGSKIPEASSKGGIVVGDDVWLGFGVTVLDGVRIGQGAVVAAGAVVSKDVEPYSIVGGVPAKTIAMRFEAEIVKELLTLDLSKLDRDYIQENLESLYEDVNLSSIQKFKELAKWN